MSNPDPARAARVRQTMLGMKKPEIGSLQDAYERAGGGAAPSRGR
jgi:hypothetical protein